MKAAFAGSIAVRLAEPVRRRLTIPCEIVTGDEAAILLRQRALAWTPRSTSLW